METDFKLTQGKGQRILAAIVFTDVVGFTALANEDEEKTLKLIKDDSNRFAGICEKREGVVFKTTGDGLLMCFQSAVQAVACSMEIQNAQVEITRNSPKGDVLKHRIGIHLGDVIVQSTD